MKHSTNPPSLVINMHDEVFDCIGAIESFRKFIPDGQIRLTGNSELHVQKVAEYTGLSYSVSPRYFDQISRIRALPIQEQRKESIDALTQLFKFFLKVTQELPESKVFYMHPDHRLLRKPKQSEMKFAAELTHSNPISKEMRIKWQDALGKELGLKHYGIPTYFDRDVLVSTLEFLTENNSEVMKKLIHESEVFIYDDLLLSAAIAHCGYEVKFKGLTRELRRRRILRHILKKPLLVHQIERINPPN